MCMGSGGGTPAPTVTYSAPTAPKTTDAAVQQARTNTRSRQQAAAGAQSTILTGATGLSSPASTTNKTLLGA